MKVDFNQQVGGYITVRALTNSDYNEGSITFSTYSKGSGAEFFATMRLDDTVKRII